MDRVEKDLTQIVHNQHVFLTFQEIIRDNQQHIRKLNGSIFCDFVRDCYVPAAVMGVRRHLKSSEDSVSLRKVLEQMETCANQFTYDFYLAQFPPNPDGPNWQRPTLGNFSKDGKTISAEIIDSHIDMLEKLDPEIEQYADRMLAHLDRQGFQGKATFGDLRKSVDMFNRLTCKYLSLINGQGFQTLEPEILCDWTRIFYSPMAGNRCLP